MEDVIVARAPHVLGVVIWIGGVATVTMVVLPALRRRDLGSKRLQVFEAIERRFAWHARIATVIVGLTGFYMTSGWICGIDFGRSGSGDGRVAGVAKAPAGGERLRAKGTG